MMKRILWPSAAAAALFAMVSLSGCGGSGNTYEVGAGGASITDGAFTFAFADGFASEAFRVDISPFEPVDESVPLGLADATGCELAFADLADVGEGFAIHAAGTAGQEVALGFLGVHEGDRFVYYPIPGEADGEGAFAFAVPAAAIRNSTAPLRTAWDWVVDSAHAADSMGGYVLRWLMPAGIVATATDNFRIFHPAGMQRQAIDAAADELESKYRLYARMGYALDAQKSLGRINAYVAHAWDETLDGELVGRNVGDHELYKFVFINGANDEKKIRDTAAHELFHVAQLPYGLPEWLEEATASYMEKYSKGFAGYPAASRQYYDLLCFQGIGRTSTAEVRERDFGYALAAYIKYVIDMLGPADDGVFLREAFAFCVGRDAKFHFFEDLIGPPRDWITDFYVRLLRDDVYPYGGAAGILQSFLKTTQDYSLNPESTVGRALSFADLPARGMAVKQLAFLEVGDLDGKKVGFYCKDLREQDDVDLVLAVAAYDPGRKAHGLVLVEPLPPARRVFLPPEYLSDARFTTYLLAVNKSAGAVAHHGFLLRNTLVGSHLFEDVEQMDVNVTYTVNATEDARRAYEASRLEGDLTLQQRHAKWDAVTLYSHIIGAMDYDGRTFDGVCRVRYDEKRSTVQFYFSRGDRLRPDEEDYGTGYLTDHGLSILVAVHGGDLVVTDSGGKGYQVHGKGTATQSDDGSIGVVLDVTREVQDSRSGEPQGSIAMKLVLRWP